MRLCLVISAEAQFHWYICSIVQKMGLLWVEAEGGQCEYFASQAFMPDLFLIDLDDAEEQKDAGHNRATHDWQGADQRSVIICCLTEEDKKAVSNALKDDVLLLKPIDFEALVCRTGTASPTIN